MKIIVMGVSGCGNTTLGALVARELDAPLATSSATPSTPRSRTAIKTKARLTAARGAYLATHLMRTRTGADDDGGAWFALGGHPELAGHGRQELSRWRRV